MKIFYALGVMSLGLMATLSSAQTMNKYGDCTIYPQKNKMMMAFTPAIAGQLTVQVNLPAPLWYNGDTPDTIKSGAEYCMAANMASRAGLSKLVVRNVAWDGLVAGQTKNFDLALSQISITPPRQKVVTFSTPADKAKVVEANNALAAARATWATKAPKLFTETQASDKKLSADAIARLVQTASGRGGRGGPPPGMDPRSGARGRRGDGF